MMILKSAAATLCVATAAVLASTGTADAQVYYYGSPGLYSSYYGGYYGGLGSRVVSYGAFNPVNGIGYGYSYTYPGYYGYALPTYYTPYGYHGYSIQPTPQFGYGSYSYVPTFYGW